MYSLAQKRFFAKRDGKDEVVLTMEEAEATLATLAAQDQLIVKYMAYVPKNVLEEDDDETCGKDVKRCLHCSNPLPDVPVMPGDECCDSYTGSYYQGHIGSDEA